MRFSLTEDNSDNCTRTFCTGGRTERTSDSYSETSLSRSLPHGHGADGDKEDEVTEADSANVELSLSITNASGARQTAESDTSSNFCSKPLDNCHIDGRYFTFYITF